LTLIWQLLARRRNKPHPILGWWTFGIGLHILTDFLNDIIAGIYYTGYMFTAWATWPYFNPDMYQVRAIPLFEQCKQCTTPAEYGIIAVALCVALVLRHRTARATIHAPATTSPQS